MSDLSVITKFVDALPREESPLWSLFPDEVLCESEKLADAVADLFDVVYGEPTVNTGYYDPEEDGRNGETNRETGWWYVTVG